MDLRIIGMAQLDPQHQEMHRKGEVKEKMSLIRDRRVLGDIGNLVNIPEADAAEGKNQNRPITRNIYANPPPKKLTATDVATKLAQQVTEIVTLKETTAADHVKRDGFCKKKVVKSLTSVLSVRSKAACGLSNKPRILDIDEADSHNELAQVEYVDDIYKFYKATEEESRVTDYMPLQPDINARMRSILVDWLIEVHNKFELVPETLYLTINIMDRYLSTRCVPRKELQLVGISSMLIASKYEDIWPPEVKDFISISDNSFSREEILWMEKAILEKLEWHLTVPTPYVFLVRYVKASNSDDKQMENMAFFMAELGMMYYNVSIAYPPSLFAASAVYAARRVLDKIIAWTHTLKYHTGYDEDQLKECGKALISFSRGAAESKLKAAFRKYSQAERCGVALLAGAKSDGGLE
ncbi:unnamed protein product [Rhodiola kirilowii]